MKNTVKIIAFLMASGGMASAASIIANNLVDIDFRTAGDVALGSTYTAKIGFLATSAVLTESDTFATISTNWTNAGDILFASGDAAGYDGYFNGLVNFTDLAGLAGKAVSIWVTNGSDLNAVLTHSSILFLADDDIPNSNDITIDSTTLGQFTFKLGSLNTTGENAALGGSIVLAGVPEPSAALLGAIGALGLLRRRRI
jgi:hypothetical protein